jgi:hypothetical protein
MLSQNLTVNIKTIQAQSNRRGGVIVEFTKGKSQVSRMVKHRVDINCKEYLSYSRRGKTNNMQRYSFARKRKIIIQPRTTMEVDG